MSDSLGFVYEVGGNYLMRTLLLSFANPELFIFLNSNSTPVLYSDTTTVTYTPPHGGDYAPFGVTSGSVTVTSSIGGSTATIGGASFPIGAALGSDTVYSWYMAYNGTTLPLWGGNLSSPVIVPMLGMILFIDPITIVMGNCTPGSGPTMEVPPGTIWDFAFAPVPSGWINCDGSAVSRSTYSALFGAVSTSFGNGDGSTTFNVPDFRDRVRIMATPGGLSGSRPTARTNGQTGGEEAHTLLTAELASHSHTVADPGHQHGLGGEDYLGTDGSIRTAEGADDPYVKDLGGLNDSAFTGIVINSAGSDSAHNNMQPFSVIGSVGIKT